MNWSFRRGWLTGETDAVLLIYTVNQSRFAYRVPAYS